MSYSEMTKKQLTALSSQSVKFLHIMELKQRNLQNPLKTFVLTASDYTNHLCRILDKKKYIKVNKALFK